MKKILVTGATGIVGKALVETLKSQNIAFKAAVRGIETAATKLQTEKSHLVAFDYAKPETFPKAVEGIDSVFLLAPPLQPDATALLTPFIDFLKNETDIKRVVYNGGMGIGKKPTALKEVIQKVFHH